MDALITIRIALHEFDQANIADGLVEKTCSWYRWLLDESPSSLTKWLDQKSETRIVRFDDISTNTLREYVVWLRSRAHSITNEPLAEHTINDYLRALHRFFSWSAIEYTLPNAMTRIKYPKSKPESPKAIAMDDLRRMFAVCRDDVRGARDRALLAFLIDTGARASELCGLKFDHIQFAEHRAVVTGKGNKTRAVVFTSRTATLLLEWFAVRLPVPYVFYNLSTFEALDPASGLRHVLKRIARRAGVTGRVNPHSFRHAFAREYILAGGDLATLAKLMGHNDTSTTTGYYTLFTDREIAAKHEQFSPMSRLFEEQS